MDYSSKSNQKELKLSIFLYNIEKGNWKAMKLKSFRFKKSNFNESASIKEKKGLEISFRFYSQ